MLEMDEEKGEWSGVGNLYAQRCGRMMTRVMNDLERESEAAFGRIRIPARVAISREMRSSSTGPSLSGGEVTFIGQEGCCLMLIGEIVSVNCRSGMPLDQVELLFIGLSHGMQGAGCH